MIKRWFAERLRTFADRADPEGAPRAIGWSFTIEAGSGVVFREGRGQGCPLWYLGKADYDRAHTEADTRHARVDWARLAAGEPGPWVDHVGGGA